MIQVQHTSGCSVEQHLQKQIMSITLIPKEKKKSPFILKMCGSNLEEVLGEDSESLCMIADALKVGVLIQHGVVGIQEKVKGVLVQKVHLEQDKNKGLVY